MEPRNFPIERFVTQGGETLDINLVYTVQGELNDRKDNCILVMTSYSATHEDAGDLFASSDVLDLSDYCVVVVNMLANSESSSPSNTPAPFDGPRFPLMTVHDNVRAQHLLVTQELSVDRLRLVMGFSMGGLQTFEWGAQHSDMVDAILPICGAAKISTHNWLFVEGAKAAMLADRDFNGGDYEATPEVGMEAFATVYAGWVFSQGFFREELYREMGMDSVTDVIEFMKGYFGRREPNDLLGMLATWQAANIADNDRFNGDFDAALQAITARAIVMPGGTDLYFRVADSEYEVSRMPNAELRVIESKLGHVAGSGLDPIGKAAMDRAIVDLLNG
ncbi:MAG: alpha/beta fold hydrolase [Gammaproteobacteria bacterium]|nr:alpha/beta fold hydrolase [Gammaproteobacteria bacterium]